MIDINLIRENPDLVKENLKKKFQEVKLPLVDEIKVKDNDWRNTKYRVDKLRSERNTISKKISEAKKSKDNKKAAQLLKAAKDIPKKISELESKSKKLQEEIKALMSEIPNIIHKSVPIGRDESENKVIKKIGKPKSLKSIKNHVELAESLNLIDFDSSAKVAGNGFYYLKGDLALLNQALIQFTIDFMKKKGYLYIEPPLMLRKEILAAAADLDTLKNSIYDIKDEPLSLIGTSEYSLLALHLNQLLKSADLPKKYFSYTMCFRKEIGSHGINEKGLWRTHQFNKVEQFIFCLPEESDKFYDELLNNSIEIYKALGIPIRILEMCSGDLQPWKAKSADLEAWRPTTKSYEEVGSLTNCTDYQARKLNIRILKPNGEKVIAHTLNNTAIATSRALVTILENYQKPDGSIEIPKVLQKYTGFKVIQAEKSKPKKAKKKVKKK